MQKVLYFYTDVHINEVFSTLNTFIYDRADFTM